MRSRQQETEHRSVAVLGTGTMGAAMARRLLGDGASVAVWNRSAARAEPLASAGAVVHASAADAVVGADVVLTVLPTADALVDLMIGGRVLDALARDAMWAQLGTIGVAATERLATVTRAQRPDVSFVDAPVSGSRASAEAGQLLVLASGPAGAEERLAPVFDALGRRTLWLGDAGSGTRLKLVLNTSLAFEVEAAAEAAALATRLGIGTDVLADSVSGGPLASPLAVAKFGKISSGDHRSDFALEWALKDLDLAAVAAGPGVAPVAGAIARRWRELVAHGHGDEDVSAAGLELGSVA